MGLKTIHNHGIYFWDDNHGQFPSHAAEKAWSQPMRSDSAGAELETLTQLTHHALEFAHYSLHRSTAVLHWYLEKVTIFQSNGGCKIMFHGTIVTFCDFTQIREVWSVQIMDQWCSAPHLAFTDYTQAVQQSKPPLQNAQKEGFKKMLVRCY